MLLQLVPGIKSAAKCFGQIWSRGMFAGSSGIRADINSLQRTRNSQILDKASKLFLLKWKNSNINLRYVIKINYV